MIPQDVRLCVCARADRKLRRQGKHGEGLQGRASCQPGTDVLPTEQSDQQGACVRRKLLGLILRNWSMPVAVQGWKEAGTRGICQPRGQVARFRAGCHQTSWPGWLFARRGLLQGSGRGVSLSGSGVCIVVERPPVCLAGGVSVSLSVSLVVLVSVSCCCVCLRVPADLVREYCRSGRVLVR